MKGTAADPYMLTGSLPSHFCTASQDTSLGILRESVGADLPRAMDPNSSAKPLTAALRASTGRSAAGRFAVRPRKKGAASSGLTMGNSPANVSRNALATPFTQADLRPESAKPATVSWCFCLQQLVDRGLHRLCPRLARVHLADCAAVQQPVAPDQIERRPVLIVQGAPVGVIAVQHYRIADAEASHRLAYVLGRSLLAQLRGVDPHDHEPGGGLVARYRFHPRCRIQAVHALEGPEFHQHHFAAHA